MVPLANGNWDTSGDPNSDNPELEFRRRIQGRPGSPTSGDYDLLAAFRKAAATGDVAGAENFRGQMAVQNYFRTNPANFDPGMIGSIQDFWRQRTNNAFDAMNPYR